MPTHTYLWHNEDDGRQAARLMQAERAWVRRMVRKQYDNTFKNDPRKGHLPFRYGYAKACDDILAKLKEGR